VRVQLLRQAKFGPITAEITLDERAKFFPSDAALASWMAQADQGQAQIIYE
jgi:DNA polymerase III subunit alpha